jgi:5-methylthioadenosine/S-adenosylhomocysteine deaminase
MKIDTLIAARWIIPVEPDNRIWEQYALAVSAGKIVDILPQHEANEKYQADEIVDLDQHALIPGFINAHTHAAMTLMRGVADDLPLMEWLHRHIWPLERQWMGAAFVRDGTELAIAEMIRGGITCFNDMYFFPEVAAEQALQAGIRVCIGLIVVDFSSAWADNAEAYIDKGLALHDTLREQPLIRTAFAPHAPYSVSDDALERLRGLAQRLELPVHMHLHETRDEIDHSLERFSVRPFQRLQQLGLLGPSFIAVHMTQLLDAELDRVAELGVSVVHCPESNLKLGSGFCPVAKLLDAGINVALGTDSAASNNDLDLLGEMKTAALLAKGMAGNAAAVPAHTALRMATLNGAKALGIDPETGSLSIGKAADITAIRLDTLETQPLYDPVSQIVYAAGRDQVSDVWVAGRRLLQARTLTTLDQAAIIEKTTAWSARLRNRKQDTAA